MGVAQPHPQIVMTIMAVFCLILSLFLVNILEVFSCGCAPGSFSKSRNDAIRESWQYARNVYTATVTNVYCKCYPNKEDFSTLKCLSAVDDRDDVLVVNREQFTCKGKFGYHSFNLQDCEEVIAKFAGTKKTLVDPTSPKIKDLSNVPNCGVSTDYQRATEGKLCDLTPQPCYYTLTVNKVFKGKKKVGEEVSSSGPDVLTSCGQRLRVLEVGKTYLVGVGSPCSPIQPWRPISSFSSKEFEFLNQLRVKQEVNDLLDLLMKD